MLEAEVFSAFSNSEPKKKNMYLHLSLRGGDKMLYLLLLPVIPPSPGLLLTVNAADMLIT